jgi:hypothetical protein
MSMVYMPGELTGVHAAPRVSTMQRPPNWLPVFSLQVVEPSFVLVDWATIESAVRITMPPRLRLRFSRLDVQVAQTGAPVATFEQLVQALSDDIDSGPRCTSASLASLPSPRSTPLIGSTDSPNTVPRMEKADPLLANGVGAGVFVSSGVFVDEGVGVAVGVGV